MKQEVGFDKTHRLLTKIEYDHVFSQAKKLGSSYFIVLYRNNNLGHARLGLALSKKMIAKSHDRNRIKRILRETFRLNMQLPTVDIIVLARPNISKIKNSIIINSLNETWNLLTCSCKK